MNKFKKLISYAKEDAKLIAKKIEENGMAGPGAVCAILGDYEWSVTWVSAGDSVRNPHIAFGGCKNLNDVLKRIKEEEKEFKEINLI